jgi:hydroxymethylglutaryl-CoA lyase
MLSVFASSPHPGSFRSGSSFAPLRDSDVTTIEIVEVGPRDGIQSIAQILPTETKVAMIKDLHGAGLRRIEIGSFVSKRAVPQFGDIEEVLSSTRSLPGFDPQVLVPTERRADEALAAGANHLVFVLSVSEKHNLSNVRRSTSESLEEYRRIMQHLPAGSAMRLNVATAFDCPFDGRVPIGATMELLDRLVAIGPQAEIGLCDTTGRASPHHVEELFAACFDRYPVDCSWAFHAHDTYGLGVTNVFAAWRVGVKVFDASIAGLGGCPFAPGATGNVATEDVVWLFDGLGVTTGIDVIKLVEVAKKGLALPGALPGGRVRDALSARRGGEVDAAI